MNKNKGVENFVDVVENSQNCTKGGSMIKQLYTIGNMEVQAYIPQKANLHNLETLYDVCNELFSDYSECFYTKTELSELKKDTQNKFFKK